jgi:hypothetical protein
MPNARREREEAILKRFSHTSDIDDAFLKRLDADAIAGCLAASHAREDAIRLHLEERRAIHRHPDNARIIAILDGDEVQG